MELREAINFLQKETFNYLFNTINFSIAYIMVQILYKIIYKSNSFVINFTHSNIKILSK